MVIKTPANYRHLLLFCALSAVTVSLLATRTLIAAENNAIRIEAGQTFEIGTDTDAQVPDFSWILTKDRKFQSAQRTRFFQTRFTQVGNYVLDVSVQSPAGGQNDYRAFTVTVTEPQSVMPLPPPATPQEGVPLAAIFMTNPAPVEGKVYVPPEGGILKIDPSASQGNITSYELDLDNSVDADGDGNPTNDVDNVNTSSEKSGTPLFFFLIPGGTERKITLTVRDAGKGQSNTASVDIVFSPAPNIPRSQNPNSPILTKQDGLTISFSALVPATQSGGAQLLNEWDFGDRTRSLLTSPVHTYAAPGAYTVSLTVRDILTGQIVYAGTDIVEVAAKVTSSAQTQSQQAVQSSAPPASSAASTGGGGGSLTLSGSIVKVGVIVFILLAVAIGLYALFTWIKRKTTGSLEKTFDRMEQTILKQDPKAAVKTGKVEPMKLKKEPSATPVAKTQENPQEKVSDRENAQAEFRTQDRTPVTPIADAGPVPDWLKKAPSPPPPRRDSAEQPTPSSAAKTPEGKASVPPWLQQTAPDAQPTPEKTPAPPPPPTPPAATTASGPVPDWLKPTQTAETTPLPKPPAPQKPPPAPPASPTVSPPPRQQPAPEAQRPVQATLKPPPTPKPPSTPTPKPVPAQPQQAPKPQTPPPLQASAKAPSPPVQPQPQPQPPPPPSPKPGNNGDEPPIAIIQADSLTKH